MNTENKVSRYEQLAVSVLETFEAEGVNNSLEAFAACMTVIDALYLEGRLPDVVGNLFNTFKEDMKAQVEAM